MLMYHIHMIHVAISHDMVLKMSKLPVKAYDTDHHTVSWYLAEYLYKNGIFFR